MINKFKTIQDIDLKNKKVVLRLDLNVPIVHNQITDFTRIDASLPTIEYLLNQNDTIIILSHLGRINSYKDIENNHKSLKIVKEALAKRLPQTKVHFCSSMDFNVIRKAVAKLMPKEILVLENTRYWNIDPKTKEYVGWESDGNEKLAAFFASLGEVYVNDAFATIHRNHASNAVIAKYQKNNAIGFLMQKEMENLNRILDNPQHPFACIFGGAKVKDKIKTIYKALEIADKVIISGGMTYTFAKAMGHNVGISKVEDDLLDVARDLLKRDTKHKIVLATDYLAVKEFKDIPGTVFDIGTNDAQDYMGLDIGPKTEDLYHKELQGMKTVFYNGPLGVFEFKHFQHGTKSLLETLAQLNKKGANVIIGGGDSASAAVNFGYKDKFSFISTGGGASMRILEEGELPGLAYMSTKGLTPHINASKNLVSKYVLMSGDPLRAKWLANTYLKDVVQINDTRGMYGYSGYYKDLYITVMGHGMGMPSIGIYSYELFKFYDVEIILRLGTAGALVADLPVRSLLVAKQAYSESVYAKELGLKVENHILTTDPKLLTLAKKVSKDNNLHVLFENVVCTDCFYTSYNSNKMKKMGNSKAVEMEIFALYANAQKLNKHALGVLTISDNIVTGVEIDAKQRQSSLNEMAQFGLEYLLAYSQNNLK